MLVSRETHSSPPTTSKNAIKNFLTSLTVELSEKLTRNSPECSSGGTHFISPTLPITTPLFSSAALAVRLQKRGWLTANSKVFGSVVLSSGGVTQKITGLPLCIAACAALDPSRRSGGGEMPPSLLGCCGPGCSSISKHSSRELMVARMAALRRHMRAFFSSRPVIVIRKATKLAPSAGTFSNPPRNICALRL